MPFCFPGSSSIKHSSKPITVAKIMQGKGWNQTSTVQQPKAVDINKNLQVYGWVTVILNRVLVHIPIHWQWQRTHCKNDDTKWGKNITSSNDKQAQLPIFNNRTRMYIDTRAKPMLYITKHLWYGVVLNGFLQRGECNLHKGRIARLAGK